MRRSLARRASYAQAEIRGNLRGRSGRRLEREILWWRSRRKITAWRAWVLRGPRVIQASFCTVGCWVPLWGIVGTVLLRSRRGGGWWALSSPRRAEGRGGRRVSARGPAQRAQTQRKWLIFPSLAALAANFSSLAALARLSFGRICHICVEETAGCLGRPHLRF